MRLPVVFLLAVFSVGANAQWEIEDSHTTASLRGIANVGGGVAWASGTNGTVLRTEDGGYLWQTCSIPGAGTKDTAEKLDFRGIQAFDENTAIVMSSGLGDQSRLYKTTDGCQTWKLLFTNPDKDGFWDALKMFDQTNGIVVGDPAKGSSPVEAGSLTFRIRVTSDGGQTWVPVVDPRLNQVAGTGIWPRLGESLFAASNSSIAFLNGTILIGTSGSRVAREPGPLALFPAICAGAVDPYSNSCGIPWTDWASAQTPIRHTDQSSGIFSIAAGRGNSVTSVGGDYTRPKEAINTAAYSQDGGLQWYAAQTPPHGYRSAVAYDAATKTWITVGPNGTDISIDDGRNWRPLTPTSQDDKDADKNWNALSLPFVVGPHGRIGKLRTTAIETATIPSAKPAPQKK